MKTYKKQLKGVDKKKVFAYEKGRKIRIINTAYKKKNASQN